MTMAVITVQGTDLALTTREGECLTETFRRAGLAMRDGCRRGGCGLCRVDLVAGEIRLERVVSEQALPAADRADGVTLACRAIPVGNVTIAVPEDGKFRCIAPMLTKLALAGAKPD
jgi:CDP-4-dehydro-6-deoxyglucose reductase